MNTKKSLFNIAFVKNDIKQYRWMSVLIFIFLAFTCFIGSGDRGFLLEYFTSRTLDWIFLTVIVASLSGTMLFSYVHKVSMITRIHSLPISRSQIVNSKLLAASIVFLLPYFIMMIIGLIGAIINNGSDMIQNIKLVCFWFITVTIIFLAFFLFSSLVTIITRSTVSAIVLTIICNLLPSIVLLGVSFIIMKLYNYDIGDDIFLILSCYISPISGTIHGFTDNMLGSNNFTVLSYIYHFRYLLVQIAGYYLLLQFAFKRKNVENASHFIAFRGLVPVFKWTVAILVTLLMFMIYFTNSNFNIAAYVLIGLLGMSVGYTIGNLLICKTLKFSGDDKKAYFKSFMIIGVIFVVTGVLGVVI